MIKSLAIGIEFYLHSLTPSLGPGGGTKSSKPLITSLSPLPTSLHPQVSPKCH